MRGTPPRRDPLRVCLWAVSFAFALFLAYRFLTVVATVALLVAAAVLLAVAASGPIEALAKRRVPRTPAAAVVFLGGAGLLALGGSLLVFAAEGQILALLSSLPAALSELSARVEDLASRLGLPLPGDDDRSAFSLVSQARQIVGGGVVGLFSTAASVLVGLVVVFFLSFYVAANPGPVVGWATRLFPPERRPRVREVLSAVRSALLGWLKGQLGAMAIIGALSTVAFFLIGLPGALFLGLFAGLLNFVPYVGPLVSFVPPLLLALLISPFTVLLVAVAYAGVQFAESYLITPLIMQRAASVHPAVVIAAVAGLGTAFGVLGALLAVPAAVTIGVLVNELWFRGLEESEGREPAGGTSSGAD